MKPFSTIAIPHKDILEGKLTMDVFAADLWQVFEGKAPEEYQDPDIFFKKTYLTYGMKNLLDVVKKRLDGRGGDPVIQLQTPFGGGKTHSLIALFHKVKEWKVNIVVIDGTALDPKETTLWGEMEMQLTGKINLLKGKTAPGREKLKDLFEKKQPLLILIDEILEYTTKAGGIKVGDSNLAAQTIAFIHELTGTVKILPKSVLVITLPSSLLEHYDDKAEELFQQLQKVTGRMEKVFTPVQDEEIAHVIRSRLFSSIDKKSAQEVINEFLNYAEKEKIIPEGVDKATYRERFKNSFPFQPEVINVLYKRWGSFPTFQRTRGVLRILALVIHSLKDSKIPFIRLGDFDLKNEEIRRELIKHIGYEYDSVIASDITSLDSGAKKVDKSLGNSYSSFHFGTKVATAIFMYSFSGGPEKGATINEIKLSCADLSFPSSVIVEVISKLRENLFYLSDEGLYFTNQPNLNRILLTRTESVRDLESEERNLLSKGIKKWYFDTYIWPTNSSDIPDTPKLKLVVLRSSDKWMNFLENYGERPRIYRNTLIFLCPPESERMSFYNFLKKKLAWQEIEKDKTLRLTDEQRRRVKEEIKKNEMEAIERIRTLYRNIFLPGKKEPIDLGIPTHGIDVNIDKDTYERLKSEGEILEKLSPLTIKDKYLKDKDYVPTRNILESFYKTPGEIRITKDEVFKDAIKEGVKQGLFGLGILENERPLCKYFKEDCIPELVEGEIIIKTELCLPCEDEGEIKKTELTYKKEMIETKIEKEKHETVYLKDKYFKINLKIDVPVGKLSDIVRTIHYINKNFNKVKVKVEISAQDGMILKSEYEEKVKEAINQLGEDIIELEEIE